MAVSSGDNGRPAHGRAYRTRAFAASASAITFFFTVGALAIHDRNKAGATTNVNTGVTTPTTQFAPSSPFDDDGNTNDTVNPFSGRATPGRSRSGSGFGQPDTSSRGS